MRAAFAFAALAVLVSLASCRSPPKCNCQCTFNYDPVCAVDSRGTEETYPNECSFECFKCTHSKNLVIRSRGECTGRTSSRNGKVKSATANLTAQRPSTNKCNCQCPLNYAPLCAVDSKGVTETYPNQCSFDCYKCTHEKDLRVRSQGECPNQGSVRPPRPTPGPGQKPNSKCNCKCTFEYRPVCAVDPKGVEETYPTACALECYKCSNGKELRIIKQGECSGQTFPNRPSQPNAGNQKPTGKCNCKCPHNYDPVCAVDPRGTEETYPSACSFECYKCTHGKELRVVKQGECSNKATARPPQRRPPNRTDQNYNPRPTINSKNCKCICTQDYTPLCAVNSKGRERTFPNRCNLDCQNCQLNEDFVERRSGDCEGRFPPNKPRTKTQTA